jgi:hypothetical protein
MTMRVRVDVNTRVWDERGRVWINTLRHPTIEPALSPGQTILLWDSDLEVLGTVERDDRHPARRWLARPDWSTKRDVCGA